MGCTSSLGMCADDKGEAARPHERPHRGTYSTTTALGGCGDPQGFKWIGWAPVVKGHLDARSIRAYRRFGRGAPSSRDSTEGRLFGSVRARALAQYFEHGEHVLGLARMHGRACPSDTP
jgi:hypothetical protein